MLHWIESWLLIFTCTHFCPICSQGSPSYQSLGSLEHHGRVFGRFRARHQRSSSNAEESLGLRTVDLRTSTIKLDADDTDLRLCFRIISPSKTYTLLVSSLEGASMCKMDDLPCIILSLHKNCNPVTTTFLLLMNSFHYVN